LLTRPFFAWAQRALPQMSATEREAIEAGDVWLDADLFTGSPDWEKFLNIPAPKLAAREQAFLDGPVEELCAMIDEWDVIHRRRDLSPEVWTFLKREKFFGMIIPERYGGLEFSPSAQSEVIRKISARSTTAAVTVMVPNSLGPGELLLQFGTNAQKERWLPRLADGRDIPCFGLTSPKAGSDAAAMTDAGIVAWGEWEGRKTLGIRLNWEKRYITLAPVASVLGLAFKLYDPEHLAGKENEPGITVALIPTHLPGVTIGRRHLPASQAFQNGPTSGKDVFVPMDAVIGGVAQLGKGWKMLMSALAAGRGISLPSLAAGGAAFCADTAGAYARVRRQFGLPIGRFEGVQAPLAEIAGNAYLLDAGRKLTTAGLDQGRKLAVLSAIMKYHATEALRRSMNAAMDIHGGKAIIDGPKNYLANLYRSVPISITVEGANLLTRNLIIFGQGAIRCHPYLLKEILALGDADPVRGLQAFDAVFWKHVGHAAATFFRAGFRAWTEGLFAPAGGAAVLKPHFRRLSRYAAAFALVADAAFLKLGGALKRREMLSARLGDMLSELYLLAAVLKRFSDEGAQAADRPLLEFTLERGYRNVEAALAGVLDNFPGGITRLVLRRTVLPFGVRKRGPRDDLTRAAADILLAPSAARERLTAGLYRPNQGEELYSLGEAFRLAAETEPLRKKLKNAGLVSASEAVEKGVFTHAEAASWTAMEEAAAAVIAVDDFPPAGTPAS
ncbi:MAG TPA: acyl-CoA dehydrogenase, partial [Sphingomonadales bacterium]|nr:acyl-CoA dehydrogenase [Sphingomonadales bacterium]